MRPLLDRTKLEMTRQVLRRLLSIEARLEPLAPVVEQTLKTTTEVKELGPKFTDVQTGIKVSVSVSAAASATAGGCIGARAVGERIPADRSLSRRRPRGRVPRAAEPAPPGWLEACEVP